MNRDVVMAWIAIAMGLSLAALFLDATLALSGGVSMILMLTLWLGAMKGDDVGPFLPYIAASGAVWLVAFTLMHLLPQSADELVLGFPPATAAMVYGLWILPLFTATLPYAIHFDRFTLTEDKMREIDRAGEEG